MPILSRLHVIRQIRPKCQLSGGKKIFTDGDGNDKLRERIECLMCRWRFSTSSSLGEDGYYTDRRWRTRGERLNVVICQAGIHLTSNFGTKPVCGDMHIIYQAELR